MPTFTRAEVESAKARKSRRDQQPVKGEGELLAVFVAGNLKNPLNAFHGWVTNNGPKYKREWRDRVAMALMEARWKPSVEHLDTCPLAMYGEPAVCGGCKRGVRPKHVTFTASLFNKMDGDGLQAALKPVRDALVECGVISGDAERDQHVFSYSQQIDRKNRGVEIRVRLKGDA